jgi:hypothetical protein
VIQLLGRRFIPVHGSKEIRESCSLLQGFNVVWMKLRNKGTILVVLVIIAAVLIQAPLVNCRSEYEDIVAGFTWESVEVQGNLTYPTDMWYFNVPKTLMFSLTVDVPENTTVSVNVTRLFLFLEFLGESPDVNVAYLLNESHSIRTSFSQSAVILNDSHTVSVLEEEVEFIPEGSNWAALGFCVFLEVEIIVNGVTEFSDSGGIYSHEPQSVQWSSLFGHFTRDNEDRMFIYPYSSYINEIIINLMPIGGSAFILLMCAAGAYRSSNLRRRRRASNLKSYLKKESIIYGRVYKLGGVTISLAYYMYLLISSEEAYFGEFVSKWARSEADISLPSNLDSSGVPSEHKPTWYELERELARNARKVDVFLYKQVPRGKRAEKLVNLLRKHGFQVSQETEHWISTNIDREVEEEYKRVHPSGELFSSLRIFVESHLHDLVPSELSQLRGALELLEKQPSPETFASVALTCRDVYQETLYQLVTDEKVPPDKTKPSLSQSKQNAELLVNWIKQSLMGESERPMKLTERGFDLFEEYTNQLDTMIQRNIHKKKVDLLLQEVIGHVISLYNLLNELFVLLERVEEKAGINAAVE